MREQRPQIINDLYEIPDKAMTHQKRYNDLITFNKDRARRDRKYTIDASSLENRLYWKEHQNSDRDINNTIESCIRMYNG